MGLIPGASGQGAAEVRDLSRIREADGYPAHPDDF
jgi:hypothetical protein